MTTHIHGSRAALYSAAATAFVYPDEAVFDDLTDSEVVASLRLAADVLDLDDALHGLLEAIEAANPDDLRTTFTSLFAVPEDGAYPVIPYEANYTAPDEVAMQQHRIAEVAGLLGSVDLERSDRFDDRQDHVAVELELMQVLAAMRAVAIEEDAAEREERIAKMEATVLSDHLADFVPALAHDLRQATDNPVYLAAADLAEELVVWDNRQHVPVEAPASGGGPR
jgi:TorA-specific chaperone